MHHALPLVLALVTAEPAKTKLAGIALGDREDEVVPRLSQTANRFALGWRHAVAAEACGAKWYDNGHIDVWFRHGGAMSVSVKVAFQEVGNKYALEKLIAQGEQKYGRIAERGRNYVTYRRGRSTVRLSFGEIGGIYKLAQLTMSDEREQRAHRACLEQKASEQQPAVTLP